jgi:hypothetical protein
MSQENSETMEKARRARDRLVAQFIHHPDVVLIDIGLPLGSDAGKKNNEIVIRIHVRKRWFTSAPEERLNIPDEIDGIRVIVIPGDYHLDQDTKDFNY